MISLKQLSSIVVPIFLAAFITIITVQYNTPIALLVVVSGISLILFLFNMQFMLHYYMASFFIGNFIVGTDHFGVTINDMLFPIIILAVYSSRYSPRAPENHDSTFSTILFKWYFLFACIVTISFLVNFNNYSTPVFRSAFWQLYRFLQLPLLIWSVAKNSPDRDNRKSILVLFILLSLLQLPVSYIQFNMSNSVDAIHGTLTAHHSFLGSFMLLSIAISTYFTVTSQSFTARILFALSGLAALITHFISSSRSALLGLGIALSIFIISKIKLNKQLVGWIILTPLVLITLYEFTPLKQVITRTFNSESGTTIDMSSASRLIIWQGAIEHYKHAPLPQKLIGVGAGDYNSITYKTVLWAGHKNAMGAHNNPLHVLCETGIIGLLVFFGLFTSTLKSLWSDRKKSPYSRILFYITIALLLSGISQETFWMQKSFSNLWALYIFILLLNPDIAHERPIIKE